MVCKTSFALSKVRQVCWWVLIWCATGQSPDCSRWVKTSWVRSSASAPTAHPPLEIPQQRDTKPPVQVGSDLALLVADDDRLAHAQPSHDQDSAVRRKSTKLFAEG